MAPVVNRQPGHHREPRRAPCTRESAQISSRKLLRAFVRKRQFAFLGVNVTSVPPNVWIVKLPRQS
eukprot:8487104-Pyramimonas_sp.AAC.1